MQRLTVFSRSEDQAQYAYGLQIIGSIIGHVPVDEFRQRSDDYMRGGGLESWWLFQNMGIKSMSVSFSHPIRENFIQIILKARSLPANPLGRENQASASDCVGEINVY